MEEIVKLIEEEAAPVNIFHGADSGDPVPTSKSDRKAEKILADIDRDEVLKRNCKHIAQLNI